jgi:hypothetical protein
VQATRSGKGGPSSKRSSRSLTIRAHQGEGVQGVDAVAEAPLEAVDVEQ